MILVTGGAGFIGANFILDWIKGSDEAIVNLDKLTYAGNLESLSSVHNDPGHIFIKGSIEDATLLQNILSQYRPRAVINFAAESHVDRSITSPGDFVNTNVIGTYRLLEAVRSYFDGINDRERSAFRFLHVSTDEVFGSLSGTDEPFYEETSYKPNSAYSASKASSDHFVRAWHKTYSLPTLTSNCSNNYGPYQFPEKLIPLVIVNALSGNPLPVYGDGKQIRDWLYVSDHCSAIRMILEDGKIGETYNVGGGNEKQNIEIVTTICDLLDGKRPKSDGASYRDQIAFVEDRKGHDRRYAVNSGKLQQTLGWQPEESFATGIEKTVDWYLQNTAWIEGIVSGRYLQSNKNRAQQGG